MAETTPQPAADTPLATRAVQIGSIVDAEWQAVLNALRAHGPEQARLVVSRGKVDSTGRPARRRTLDDVLARDPRRKEEWDGALGEFIAKFVHEAHAGALSPEVIRRYDKKTGALVEERVSRRDQNWMLIHVLRRYDPEWRDQKRVAVDGAIQHTHEMGARPGEYCLTADDILRLPVDQQQRLIALLGEVEEMKAKGSDHGPQQQPRQLPAPETGYQDHFGGGAG